MTALLNSNLIPNTIPFKAMTENRVIVHELIIIEVDKVNHGRHGARVRRPLTSVAVPKA